MNNIKFLTVVFLLFSFSATAQNNIGVQWQRYFGGSNYDEGTSIAKSNDGGFIVVGTTYSSDGDVGVPGIRDTGAIWILKFNATGAIQWKKLFDRNIGKKIIQTSDSNFVVCGFDYSNFTNKLSLIKLKQNGDIIWRRIYPDTSLAVGVSIVEAADKSLVVTGYNYSNSTDLWISKFTEDASSIVWKTFLRGSKSDQPKDIKRTIDGGFIITGSSNSNDRDFTGNGTANLGYTDLILIKLNSSGVTQWKRMYHSYRNDGGNSVVETEKNGFLVVGYSYSASFYNFDDIFKYGTAWIINTNSSGDIMWQKTLTIDTSSEALDVTKDFKNNNYTICGVSLFKNLVSKGFLLNIDSSGNIQWHKRIDSPSSSLLSDLVQYNDSTYISIGGSREKNDLLVLKLGSYNVIKGTIFLDANSNGIKDAAESDFNNAIINTTKPGVLLKSESNKGQFYTETDTGTYTTTLQLQNPYYTVVPASHTSIFTSYFNVDSFSFAVQPLPNKEDVTISLLPLTPARPGFNAGYLLNYKNVGTTTIASGAVKFVKNSKTSFVSALPTPSSTNADTLTWNYSNLKPLDTASIVINLKIASPPTANINDTLKYIATILPVANDLTPANDTARLKQVVIGSYDPNDKRENYAGAMPVSDVNNGSYINYYIRFQNTGNDTAFTVRIADTLDANLDWNSLQMIGSSHIYNLAIKDGNKLMWTFENIKLVDSFRNEPLSHGYIAFKIKPKASLASNAQIKNSAAIYFDYNLPVLTNTTVTTIVDNTIITAVRNISTDELRITLSPNPAKNQTALNIAGSLAGKFDVVMIDNNGKIISSQTITKNSTAGVIAPIVLQHLPAGIYFIQVRQKQKQWVQKIIIQ